MSSVVSGTELASSPSMVRGVISAASLLKKVVRFGFAACIQYWFPILTYDDQYS